MQTIRQRLGCLLGIAVVIAFAVVLALNSEIRKGNSKITANRLQDLVFHIKSEASLFHESPVTATIRDQAGRPLYSWRLMAISRMIPIPYQLKADEPWDSENNRNFSGAGYHYVSSKAGDWPTVVAVDGPNTVFNGTFKLDELLEDPTSGLSLPLMGTVALVESFKQSGNWMAPGDLNIDDLLSAGANAPMSQFIGKPRQGKGFHVVLWSGQVYELDVNVPANLFAQFCTLEPPQDADFVSALRTHILSGSGDPFQQLEPY